MTTSLAEEKLLDRKLGELLLFVVTVPTAIAMSDEYLLQLCRQSSVRDLPHVLWPTYAWFCVQVAAIAWSVGTKQKSSVWWWVVLVWTLLLIDLRVFAVAAASDFFWQNPARTLAYAFVSAQVAVAVVWAVLGSGNWRHRIPVCVSGLACAIQFGVALAYREMATLMVVQTIATTFFCLLMGVAGFRIRPASEPTREGNVAQATQFSLRHIFYWTTAVCLGITASRFLFDWSYFVSYLPRWNLTILVSTGALVMVSVVGTWIALGREHWLLRLAVGGMMLSLTGASIGMGNASSGRLRWGWRGMGDNLWDATPWTILAGLFLAGMLLVFRARGERLLRVKGVSPA